MRKPSPALLIAVSALFVALGGVGVAATGGNFILGKANSATSTTSLSAPIGGKALQVSNTSTTAGATPLGLFAAAGHAPFTVNTSTKVANLNADRLDGIDSTAFVKASTVQIVGPVQIPAADPVNITTFQVGKFKFEGRCYANSEQAAALIYVQPLVDGSAYESVEGNNDSTRAVHIINMSSASDTYDIEETFAPAGGSAFGTGHGTLITPDGQQVSFDVYGTINAAQYSGCTFGGAFTVK